MQVDLTTLEAARRLGVTQTYILDLIHNGRLPAGQRQKGKRRVWAINPDDLATIRLVHVAPITDAPEQLCECGCGESTGVAAKTGRGYIKGQRLRFLPNHNGLRISLIDYIVNPETGCWEWQGAIDVGGYGRTAANGRWSVPAHRVYYERAHGPIPGGLDLDHMCHNADLSCAAGNACRHRRCVNPDHLEPATRSQNVRRGRSPKITKAIADEIRRLRGEEAWTWARLSQQFGVSTTMARNIAIGKWWRD